MLLTLHAAAQSSAFSQVPVSQELGWMRTPFEKRVQLIAENKQFPDWKLREMASRLELIFLFKIEDGCNPDKALEPQLGQKYSK